MYVIYRYIIMSSSKCSLNPNNFCYHSIGCTRGPCNHLLELKRKHTNKAIGDIFGRDSNTHTFGCSLDSDNFCCHRGGTRGPCHYLVELKEKYKIKDSCTINCTIDQNNFCHHRTNTPGPCNYLLKQKEQNQMKRKYL